VGSLRLNVKLASRGPAAAVVLSDDQVDKIGEGARRFPVRATINDYTWRTTVTRRRDEFLLGLSRAVRKQTGVEAGDTVEVEITLDTSERKVDVPPALAEALARDRAAAAAFEKLAYSHRKEYARWVDEAKRDETRRRRVSETLRMLREGKTRS
jgi:bacteriocin resistance YdeI/OmpD-like protein/uncharacterized protein DUF1905